MPLMRASSSRRLKGLVVVAAARSQEQDRYAVAGLAHLATELEAVHVGQHDVQYYQVDTAAFPVAQSVLGRVGQHRLVPLQFEIDGQAVGQMCVVLDHEYAPFHDRSSRWTGKVKVKVAPRPSSLSRLTEPPRASAVRRTR